MSSMVVVCKGCGALFHMNQALFRDAKGARVRCRKCGERFVVLNPVAPPAAPAPVAPAPLAPPRPEPAPSPPDEQAIPPVFARIEAEPEIAPAAQPEPEHLHITEAEPEPVSEAAAVPVPEPAPEPVAEPAALPVPEPAPEPGDAAEAAREPEPAAAPELELVAEAPLELEPAAEAAPEPVAVPEPVAETLPEPEPVAEAAPEPVAEATPESELVAEAARELEFVAEKPLELEPAAAPEPEPVAEPAPEFITEAEIEFVTESDLEPVAAAHWPAEAEAPAGAPGVAPGVAPASVPAFDLLEAVPVAGPEPASPRDDRQAESGALKRRLRATRWRGRLRAAIFLLVPVTLLLAGGAFIFRDTKFMRELAGRDFPPPVPAKTAIPAPPVGVEEKPAYDIRDTNSSRIKAYDGTNLFVIQGRVANVGKGPSRGIRVYAALLGKDNQALVNNTVFAGNVVDNTTLRHSKREVVAGFLGVRYGEGNANREIPPGKSLPFMVVLFDPPGQFESFTVKALDAE